jgi:predicted GIY-YIG superfamily endonuclease
LKQAKPFALSLSKGFPFPSLASVGPMLFPRRMSFWTNMLHCSDRSFYVGHTDDLEARIALHRSGAMSGYTAGRLPVVLVWSETFPTRAEALATERQLKGWSRARKMALIRGDWDELQALARKKGRASTQPERNRGGEQDPQTPFALSLSKGLPSLPFLIHPKREGPGQAQAERREDASDLPTGSTSKLRASFRRSGRPC